MIDKKERMSEEKGKRKNFGERKFVFLFRNRNV